MWVVTFRDQPRQEGAREERCLRPGCCRPAPSASWTQSALGLLHPSHRHQDKGMSHPRRRTPRARQCLRALHILLYKREGHLHSSDFSFAQK